MLIYDCLFSVKGAQWASSEQFLTMLSVSSPDRDQNTGEVSILTQDSEVRRDLDRALAEGVICVIMKKKCDRHMGWQKTRENDFETELGTLVSYSPIFFVILRCSNHLECTIRMQAFKNLALKNSS